MSTKNKDAVYNALEKVGVDNLGTREDFYKRMNSEANRIKVYDILRNNNFDNLGTFGEFENKLSYTTPEIITPNSPYAPFGGVEKFTEEKKAIEKSYEPTTLEGMMTKIGGGIESTKQNLGTMDKIGQSTLGRMPLESLPTSLADIHSLTTDYASYRNLLMDNIKQGKVGREEYEFLETERRKGTKMVDEMLARAKEVRDSMTPSEYSTEVSVGRGGATANIRTTEGGKIDHLIESLEKLKRDYENYTTKADKELGGRGNGFWRGLDEFSLLDTVTAGWSDVLSGIDTALVLEKASSGQPLTKVEQLYLPMIQEKARLGEIVKAEGGLTTGYNIGAATAQMPSFIVGMMTTSPIGKGINMAVKGVAKEAVEEVAKKTFKDFMGKAAKSILSSGAYAAAATPLQSMMYDNYVDNTINEYLEFGGVNSSTAERLVKGYRQALPEIFFESLGGIVSGIAKYVLPKSGIKARIATKLAEKWGIHEGVMKDIAERAAFGGFLEETEEEFLTALLSPYVEGLSKEERQQRYGEALSTEGIWTTIATTALVSGSFGIARGIESGVQVRNYSHLEQKALDALGNIKDANLRQMVFDAGEKGSLVETARAMAKIDWSAYDAGDVGNAIDYFRNNISRQVYAGVEVADQAEKALDGMAASIVGVQYGNSGKVITAKVADSPVILLGVDTKTQTAMVRYEDGRREQVPLSEVKDQVTMPVDDLVAQLWGKEIEKVEAEVVPAQEAERKAKVEAMGITTSTPQSRTYNVGDMVNVNGEEGEIISISPASRTARVNTPSGEAIEVSLDEITPIEGETSIVEEEVVETTTPTTQEAQHTEQESQEVAQPQAEVEAPAKVEPVRNEKGEVDFGAMDVEQSAAFIEEDMGEEQGLIFADARIAEQKAQLKKVESAKDVPTDYDAAKKVLSERKAMAEVIKTEIAKWEAIKERVSAITAEKAQQAQAEQTAPQVEEVAPIETTEQTEVVEETPQEVVAEETTEPIAEETAEQAPYDPFKGKATKVMEEKEAEVAEAMQPQTKTEAGVVFDENTPKISNIAVFDKVAKALGVSVVFKPIVADAKGRVVNAEYDDKTKTIYVGTQNRERGLQFLLGHEMLHRMFDLAPSAYKNFRDAAKAFVGEETFNRRVANTIATYMAQDRNPFFVDIEQEVVADIAGELVGGRYDAFASFIEQNKTDKGFLATLRNILQHVKDFFKGSKAKRIPQNVDNAIKMLNELLAESSKQMEELSKAMEVPQEIVNAVEDIPNVEGAESRASIKIAPMLEAKSHDYLANYYGENKGKVSARFRPVAKGITAEDLKVGDDAINAMVTIMQPHLDEVVFGKRLLPEEVYGSGYSTIFSNGSYGRSMENTSICTRTLAYNEFTDEIKEQIGRPLTTAESFLASQMLYDIAVDPQCLYCYVSLDRKAYDQELLRYIAQRDAIIEEYRAMEDKSPEAIKALYTKFLNGRKDTEPMRDRFARWIAAVDNNEPLITRQDLATKNVRNRMKEQGGNIEWQIQDAESYAQNAAQAKKSEDYRAYAGEILRMPFKTVKALSEEYGLRFYSFSEYSPAFIVENMQMIRDAALRGLRGFAYTKELDFVRIFAPSGININVSVFGRKNSDGNVVPDVRQGASWAEAQALREQFPNVGITFVATNDTDVEWAMAQDWVDVVIPFHIVRTGADVAKFYGWTDYTSMQAEKGAKKANVMPTEHKNNKETFLALCEERGLIPRFSKWVENPNYMKLVNETRRSVDETPILKPIFNLEAAQASWNAFVEKGGYYGGWYEVDAEGYNEAVAQVVSDIEAGKSADEVSYGRQDIPADYAEKARQARVNRTHGNTPRYSLRETNNRFNEQLAMLTEENKDNVVLSLGMPSGILRAAGVVDKPMKLYGNKVIKKQKDHGFELGELQNLPIAVAHPIAVFNNYNTDDNRSILTELKTKDGNFLVSLNIGKDQDIDFYIVTSVFGKGDNKIVEWINKGYATYIDKEKALNYLHHSAPIAEALSNSRLISATNIVKDFENPSIEPENVRHSIKAMDAPYLEAVERGDMETAQRMVMEAAKIAMPNTKVVDEDGNPKVVYHQTNASVYVNRETGQNWDELDWRERMEWDERDDWDDYWEEREFNTFSRVNARTTNEFDGFFFAPEYDEYHEYGDRTIAAFVNIENPASRGDYNIDSSKNNAGREERIRLQNEGYDGVIREYDGVVDEYIAFEPNQIKSADPVTYDDAGNVIPLSERFNPRKADVRYSISTSAREFNEVLRNALENNGIVMPNLSQKEVEIVKYGDEKTPPLKASKDDLLKWGKENVVTTDSYIVDSKGEKHNCPITANVVREMLSDKAINASVNKDIHLLALPLLKRVLANSIEVEIHPDYNKIGNVRKPENGYNPNILMHRFYGAVEIGGEVYRAKTTIKEYKDKNTNLSPYTYEVTKIELLPTTTADAKNAHSRQASEESNSISATKLLNNVEKSYDKGKKILEESEDITRHSIRTMTPQEIEEGVKYSIKDYANSFKSLIEEYKALDKNDTEALADFRARKRNLVEDYWNVVADELGLPCKSIVVDSTNNPDALRPIYEVCMDSYEAKMEQMGEDMYLIPTFEQFLTIWDEAHSQAQFIEGTDVVCLDVADIDGYNSRKVTTQILLHENIHYLVENNIPNRDLAGVWRESASTEFGKKLHKAYKDATSSGLGNELLVYTIAGVSSTKIKPLMNYIKGENGVSIEDVVNTFENSLPLRDKNAKKILELLREGYERNSISQSQRIEQVGYDLFDNINTRETTPYAEQSFRTERVGGVDNEVARGSVEVRGAERGENQPNADTRGVEGNIEPTRVETEEIRQEEHTPRKGGLADDVRGGQRGDVVTKGESEQNNESTDQDVDYRYSIRETNPDTLKQLNEGDTIKVYRAMQIIDGKLYPPMSAKVEGKLREPIELGVWERAEERPDLADSKGYFKLDKGNKSSVPARYNPYIHTSLTPLNDQFSSAQDRPNLVTVEVEVPVSELTSGYKAEKAKDSVGKMEWKAGVVQSKLSGTRTVILSRWDKPIRIVPDSEVAQRIVEMFDGKQIEMPSNVVTPSLRNELEKLGVPFRETDNQGRPLANPKYDESRFSVRMTPTERLEQELGYSSLSKFETEYRAFVTAFANNMVYIKKLQEALKEAGVVITDSNNYYENENATSARIEAAMDEYDSKLVQPMLLLINELHSKFQMDYNAVTNYLLAKHSLERHNSGLNALNPNADAVWGRNNVEAIVNDFESKVPSDVVDQLWEMVAKINDSNLEILVEAGIKSKKDIDTIKSHNWKYYVPLKEWDLKAENLVDPVQEYDMVANHRNGAVKGKWFDPTAKGRTTKPSEPLGQIIAMGYRAIATGETNKAKQSLYYLLRDAERKLGSSISQYWELSKRYFQKNNSGIWEEVYGHDLVDAGVDLAQVEQEQREINKMERERRAAYVRANQLEAQGRNADALLERQRGDALGVEIKNRKDNMDVRIDKPDMDYIPNEIKITDVNEKRRLVLVYVGGQPIYIKFTNPHIADAVNQLGVSKQIKPDVWANRIHNFVRWLTRFKSKVSTNLNPNFALLTNPVRDFLNAVTYHIMDTRYSSVADFVKNYSWWFTESRKTIKRAFKGKANPLTEQEMREAEVNGQKKSLNLLDRAERNELISAYGEERVNDTLFEIYTKEGGQTGFAFVKDIQTIRNRVQKDLKRMGGTSKGGKVVKGLVNGFKAYSDAAKIAEVSTRYATFLASINKGMSVGQAVSNARNISVNFGRRGNLTSDVSEWYVFFNPFVQGLSQFTDAFKRNKKRTMGVLMGFLIGGYINALLLDLGDGDEEDELTPTKAPSWMTRNYIVVRTIRRNGRDSFIRIPLPQLFRSVWALGSIAYDLQNGRIGVGDAIGEAVKAIISDFTYGFSDGAHWLRSIAPTITQGVIDVSVNKDAWGRPIHREDIAGKGTPNAELGSKYVESWAYAIASILNKMTGGSKIESGKIDINPSDIQYLFYNFLGGIGNTGRRLWELSKQGATFTKALKNKESVSDALDQAEFELQNIPILGGILYTVGEESAWEDYERFKKEYGSSLEDKEKLLKEDNRVMTQQERADYVNRHTVWKRYNDFINTLTEIRNQYKYNSDEYEFINREINRQRALLVKMMEEVNFDKNLTDETQRIEAKYDPYRTENYIQIRKEYGNKK